MTYEIRYTPAIPARFIDNEIEPTPERIQEILEWFTGLEQSILEEGVRNPVVLTQRDRKLTSRYGGTRILIAQRHGLTVPAVIADFDGRWKQLELISMETIWDKFPDRPRKIIPKPNGLNVSGLPGTVDDM